MRHGQPGQGGPEGEADHGDHHDQADGPAAQEIVVEQPEDQGHRDGRHQGREGPGQGAHGDQLLGGPHQQHAQPGQAEQGQAGEQGAAAPDLIPDGAADHEQAAEGQGVGPDDPLQVRGAGVQDAPDGGQGDVEDGVVHHLHEHGQAQPQQGGPGRAQGLGEVVRRARWRAPGWGATAARGAPSENAGVSRVTRGSRGYRWSWEEPFGRIERGSILERRSIYRTAFENRTMFDSLQARA
ncbi:Uncharacterised protein [Mycobacteroides abscessus subsp. abscessus]|nr:Uncharacterised protein [Mycobacteroides abscessus subsp. abscessus]